MGSGVYHRTSDQDPARSAPNRLPCPKTPEPYQEGPGPRQVFCHQVRLLEASADKGLLSSFTLFCPRRLGVRASENIQADDLVFPILPSSKAPMPRMVLRNSIPSEALAGDGITTSGQGVSHGERKGCLNNIDPRGQSLEVEDIRNKRHRNLKQDLEGHQV